MKSVFKTATLFLSLACATPTFADWSPASLGWPANWLFVPVVQPYFGIDVGAVQQNFAGNFGHDHFREHYPAANFYIGAKFFQYRNFSFGLSGGYEHRFRQQDQAFYPAVGADPAPPALGFINTGNLFDSLYTSNVYAQAWHLNLESFWAICPKTELTASIGVAWMRMYFDTVAVSNANAVGFTPTSIERWNSGTDALLKLSVGVRQMITEYFGARLQATWESTSSLEGSTVVSPPLLPLDIGANLAFPQNSYTARPKNSYGLWVGFFFQLPNY